MKNYLLVSLLFIASFSSSCQTKETSLVTEPIENEVQKIEILRSPLFDNYTPKKLEVANFVAKYFNLMFDSTLEYRNSFWDSKILTYQQDYFLRGNFQKEFFYHYSPKILGIREMDQEQFEVKLEIEQNGFTYKLMNLTVAFDGLNRPYFIDQLGENLQVFTKHSSQNSIFYYSPKTTKNDSLEQKMVDFNSKTAKFFNKSTKNIKVIVLKNIKNYCEVLGFDYVTFLTYDGQTGGIAMPQENMLFSANNSPFYPHELVHLYTADFNPHHWFDEGCATYLGGSVEFSLEHHLTKIANKMDSLDFSQLPQNQKLDDDTNLKYSLGGLFCKLAMEEYGGKESLMKLLNSGRTEEDFHTALTKVFGIEKEGYDAFIREKLKRYRNN